ncbi:MAG TPA: N-acetyl-gamma-glutamyl-phosphate reductase [Acidimicrobiales bacterium]|nr:N-acetyl-gamma-glutamyl-phosphate reductase [Acidimicrobiales bacterium]
MQRIGIFGASGYTGAELLRLCAQHPSLEVALATADTKAGTAVADLYPSLAAAYPDDTFAETDPAAADGLDLVFLALPHGTSQLVVPELRKRVGAVVDLAADFRLKDPALYPQWYGGDHACPDLLDDFAYGIPELFRDQLRGAGLVAAAGCYPTAAALALAPLVRAGVISPRGLIVDAASGVSGAGRTLRQTSHFSTVNEDFTAYGLVRHRHTPEMEQAIGAEVLFTPHLAPMTRGILATCYARPTDIGADPLEVLGDFYAGEPFVLVGEPPPPPRPPTAPTPPT